LAAGNHLSERLLSRVSRQYQLSMDLFKRDRDACLSSYAALSGLEASLLRRVCPEYSYPRGFSPSVVERQFDRAGMVLPSLSSFKDALFR
jgi:hypothetical protein